ncbi:hypothetical protein KC327_g8828 [Hortaea werneckii]|nr:hypothetical protein KC358_g9345 [Hortaea werneckii]KAI6932753.1 hypothetical protein KC341_g8782 [Hortaea werneckii]KAI6940387.1 hypothetical protein KC348_g5022 [Hortaea werneckii]KAI6972376.1 hypothetical protein KC321_g6262 [Hortaea werneckii]KAI7030947.1 hypothetical protein KC366_g10052 [Hortaea werneckii]
MSGEDSASQVQPRSYRQVDSSLSDVLRESIEERARCLEVRKFCQVKPSLVQYGRHFERHSESSATTSDFNRTDAALTALLRCVLYELDADLAMISLLDDETQYFIAGASRTSLGSAQVTLESARWYGCDSVLHHGGLCERTVTIPNLPAVYEELDLAANYRTSQLPFVNGDVASFRHYAGAPLKTPGGIIIGTVFAFSNNPSSGLDQQRRQFLVDTSENVMGQLLQALQALDGFRASMFNTAIASLLNATTSFMRFYDQDPDASHRNAQRAEQYQFPFVLDIYHRAAELAVNTFELDWCGFCQLESTNSAGTSLLSEFPRSSDAELGDTLRSTLNTSTLQFLVDQFPDGAIFHWSGISGNGIFVEAAGPASRAVRLDISASIHQVFPQAQQVIFMPLWDSLHNRTAAAAFCCSKTFDRVYAGHADLYQMSAFCTSTITQVRRLEGHLLDQTKADFLGSISHEMRSPLHSTLASLELLAETAHSDHQRNLIDSANSGGRQMLDTINKVLQFTNIDPLQFEDGSKLARPPLGNRHDSTPAFLMRLSFCSFANAIKYSGIDCCLRAELNVGEVNVYLKITDCGKGIPEDFRWNSLYIPFSQANPIDPGTGLGLALVKRTLDALKGTIKIDSDMTVGTVIDVLIPLASLADEAFADRASFTRPSSLQLVPSPLQAQLFVPPAWSSGIYGSKGDRLVDNLFNSLERGLKGWVPTELETWDAKSSCSLPHVIFVRHGDLQEFGKACGTTHSDVPKVVIGRRKRSDIPAVHLSEPLVDSVGRLVEIEGPLLPSVLREAIELTFSVSEESDVPSERISALDLEDDIKQQIVKPAPEPEPQNAALSIDRDKQLVNDDTSSASVMSTEPRILLVDDNSINLKLLRMFVQKCGIVKHKSASGGQEAIDAFEAAKQENDDYFMCFMDLSMPVVDGFQATAAIRQREADLGLPKHQAMIIIALTGLVSAKDRHAAAQAGVDDFLTKPADLKTIRKCLDYWKGERSDLAVSTAVAS